MTSIMVERDFLINFFVLCALASFQLKIIKKNFNFRILYHKKIKYIYFIVTVDTLRFGIPRGKSMLGKTKDDGIYKLIVRVLFNLKAIQ